MNDKEYLELDIKQAALVGELTESAGWQFLRQWIEQGRDLHDADLKSFKYIADHEGYLTALARYNAYNSILQFCDQTIQRGQDARTELSKRSDNADE